MLSLPIGEHKLSPDWSQKIFINCRRLWTSKYQLVLICHSSVLHFKQYLTLKLTWQDYLVIYLRAANWEADRAVEILKNFQSLGKNYKQYVEMSIPSK